MRSILRCQFRGGSSVSATQTHKWRHTGVYHGGKNLPNEMLADAQTDPIKFTGRQEKLTKGFKWDHQQVRAHETHSKCTFVHIRFSNWGAVDGHTLFQNFDDTQLAKKKKIYMFPLTLLALRNIFTVNKAEGRLYGHTYEQQVMGCVRGFASVTRG